MLTEWLHLFLRWFHVFAAILWVGQTFFFTWLDGQIQAEGDVWLIHSGGFYVVERQKIPKLFPKTLHWFRWEALSTWLSGMALLVLVYYAGGMLFDRSTVGLGWGIAIGLSVLVGGWLSYDTLFCSRVRDKKAAVGLCFGVVLALAYGLTRVFSARAAYMHVGALFGTIMAANVWLRILPAQRQMLAALSQGIAPNAELAAQAKARSKHNTYLAVPLVFIMLSNHFPVSTYGHDHSWVILGGLIALGWWVRDMILAGRRK